MIIAIELQNARDESLL